jgi:hypothetical protein
MLACIIMPLKLNLQNGETFSHVFESTNTFVILLFVKRNWQPQYILNRALLKGSISAIKQITNGIVTPEAPSFSYMFNLLEIPPQRQQYLLEIKVDKWPEVFSVHQWGQPFSKRQKIRLNPTTRLQIVAIGLCTLASDTLAFKFAIQILTQLE